MDGWSVAQRLAAGRLSEGLYEMMLSSEDAAIVLDQAENIVAVNEKWQSLCGYSAREALHHSTKILQGEMTNEEKARGFAQELRTLGEARTTLANYTREGEPFAHKLHATRFTDHRTGDVFFFTEGVEVKDAAIRRAIFKRGNAHRPSENLTFELRLVGLLSTVLGVAAGAAYLSAHGGNINLYAQGGVLALGSLGARLLFQDSRRLTFLISTVAGLIGLVKVLPRSVLLPSAIPLAIVIISAILVANEPNLPPLKRLPSGSMSRKRVRRSDFFARWVPFAEDEARKLEQERVDRATAWLEKDRLKHAAKRTSSRTELGAVDVDSRLPSPTATSQLKYADILGVDSNKSHLNGKPRRSHEPRGSRHAPSNALVHCGLAMVLLGMLSVMCQADPRAPVRHKMHMETPQETASDTFARSSDWIRESLTHSMII